jgi:hypothetical protein
MDGETTLHLFPQTCQTHLGLRLAVLSTPRSGNTWMRHLLARIYDAPDQAVHHPAELDWPNLPTDCVLQLHWPRTPELLALLHHHHFRVLVMARHPLDVLLSILHFATHDSSTQHWLEGEAGDESNIIGAMPCSAAFGAYASGPRAAALLAVSRQWWNFPGAFRVRFEELVANPVQELTVIVQALGQPVRLPLADAVAATTIPKLRIQTRCNHHFWQGNPGLWKRLLPAGPAECIAAAHRQVLDELGYDCEPDLQLDEHQADANWIDLNRPELQDRLWNYVRTKDRLEQAEARAVLLEQQRDELLAALQHKNACMDELSALLERKHADVVAAVEDARRVRQAMENSRTLRVVGAVKRMLGAKKDFALPPDSDHTISDSSAG